MIKPMVYHFYSATFIDDSVKGIESVEHNFVCEARRTEKCIVLESDIEDFTC